MGKNRQLAKKGLDKLKHKDTWKKALAIIGGTILGRVGASLAYKGIELVSDNQTAKYAGGAVGSGAVAVLAFVQGWDNVGYGATITTALQAVNTGTQLAFNKSLNQVLPV